MAFKDMLLHVGTDPACASRVEVAARLAIWHDAHLTGLHVMASPPIPGYIAAELPRQIHEIQARRLRERAEQARHLFDSAVRAVAAPRVERRVAS